MLFYNPLKAVSPFVYRLASMSKYLPKTKDYYERVTLDLGTVRYLGDVNTFYKFLEEENLYNNTKLLWFGDAGIKTRETTVASTPLTFVSKGYSLDPTPNDLTQTTELNQPYLSGNIAPNERYAVKINTNSETKLLTHPDIVVTTPHTVVKVVELETTGKVEITHTEVNGVTLNTLNDVGRVYYYRIHDGAMTAEQKEAEAAFLRSIYPEIPSVQIGTQTWATSNLEMVATPMGNVIPEVQEASAVEKIINGDFESGVPNLIGRRTKLVQSTEQVNSGTYSGKISIDEDLASLKYILMPSNSTFIVGNYYKIDVSWYLPSGQTTNSVYFTDNNGVAIEVSLITKDVWVNTTFYWKATTTSLRIRFDSAASGLLGEHFFMDNLSVQELGWADRTELYDGLIAQGMTEEEATREAAAWCYYNNDPNLGAIYGKLYNWYAAKLIQNDIDAYNVANPSTPWGWRVPEDSDVNILATYLGGESVAGKKLKKEGTDYWNAPNLADNSSGLTLLGSGYRLTDGVFIDLRVSNLFHTVTASDMDKRFGFNTRLIKQ